MDNKSEKDLDNSIDDGIEILDLSQDKILTDKAADNTDAALSDKDKTASGNTKDINDTQTADNKQDANDTQTADSKQDANDTQTADSKQDPNDTQAADNKQDVNDMPAADNGQDANDTQTADSKQDPNDTQAAIEIISGDSVPDDYDNDVLQPDERKVHITRGDIIRYVLLAISCAVFIVAAYHLIPRLIAYRKESKKNNQIKEEVLSRDESDQTHENGEFIGINPTLSIDFEKLSEISADSIAWIEVPALAISYPVVCGRGPYGDDGEEFYLRHDIMGNFAWSGSIYLDYRNASDFSDDHYMILGHHMNDGSMFSTLTKYDSEDFFNDQQSQNNNYVYLYLRDEVKVYQIFAVVDAYFADDPFSFKLTLKNEDDKQEYLDHIREKQLYDTGINATISDTILTLYTCQSNSSSEERHMVHTKLITEIKK